MVWYSFPCSVFHPSYFLRVEKAGVHREGVSRPFNGAERGAGFS